MSRNIPTARANPSGSYVKLAATLCLVISVGALLYHFAFGGRQMPELRQFGSVGEFAAEEAAKVIGKSGRVVVAYDIYDPKTGGADAGKAFAEQGVQAAAFRKRLAKLGTYAFASDWKIPRPNLVFRSVWPEGNFARLLSANPSETTIVLFANPPAFTQDEKSRLLSRPGKLIVLGGVLPEVQGLAKEKVAHLVVASRFPVPPPSKKQETEREVTERVYAVVTPETVGQR